MVVVVTMVLRKLRWELRGSGFGSVVLLLCPSGVLFAVDERVCVVSCTSVYYVQGRLLRSGGKRAAGVGRGGP